MRKRVLIICLIVIVTCFITTIYFYNRVRSLNEPLHADVLCNPGLHLLPNKNGCTSCVIADGNYCPRGKEYYCCPPGTQVSRNHATSINDCVPCPEGYSNPNSCGVCQKDPIIYCYKKETVTGNEYQTGETSPGFEWIDIGESKDVTCSEEDKCYIDSSDNYVWGKFNNRKEYILQSEITNKENCKKVEEEIKKSFPSYKKVLLILIGIISITIIYLLFDMLVKLKKK